MSSPRERQLAEGIKHKLIGIQKSSEIYEDLSKWQKKVINMSKIEIEEKANLIASNIEKFTVKYEKQKSYQPDAKSVMKKIKQELEKI